MTYKFAAALVALIGGGVSTVQAETRTFGEAGLSYDNFSLRGDGLNTFGAVPNEPEHFYGGRLNGRFGAIYDTGLTWGLQGHYLKTSVGDEISPGEETNEGVKDTAQITATLGHSTDSAYYGLIAGAGQIRFTADDWDQNTTYRLLGAGAGAERGNWAYGGSFVFMDVNAVDDPETLDNAVIAKLQAEYALFEDRTFIGLYATYVDGENDVDSAGLPDAVQGSGAGVYLRHQIGTWGADNDVMLNAGLDYLKLKEDGSARVDSIASLKGFVGVSVTFGKTKEPRALRMADAADTSYVQMLTPYVD